MTRSVNPPSLSTRTIDEFLGMVRDRSGTEMLEREFRTVKNCDIYLLQAMRKRLGSAKYGGVTESSGSKVQAGFTYVAPDGTKYPIKIAGGQLRKYSGGSWSTVGSAIFTDTTTWFAQMNAQKTGASADATGSLTSADSTSITDGGAAFTTNAHVGKMLSVSSQKKIIGSNNATKIFITERFDDTPTGTYNIYPTQQEFFIATGTEFYKCDGTTLTQLDNTTVALAFTGIAFHDSRLWGWKKNRAYWSDVNNGENFSRNAWKAMQTDIQCIADFADVMMVYEQKKVTALFGSNPDQFFWKTVMTGFGAVSPKSVASYPGVQFFLDDRLGVMVVNLKQLSAKDEEIEPVSASLGYINDLILAHSANELAAACAYCDGINYYLRVGDDVYVLHVQASLETSRAFGSLSWIWSWRTYPAAIVPNSMFMLDTAFCFGGSTNGQVYEVNKAGQYTDDGTAIQRIIEKCDWNPNGTKSQKNFDALHVTSDIGGSSCSVNFTFAKGGTSFSGSPDLTVDPNTLTDRDQEIKVPSNPSDARGKVDTGQTLSFRIDDSATVGVADIELIELHYYPGIIS